MALFGNEARFFRVRVFFPACYLQNEVGDLHFCYISGITNSSSFNGKILRKKSMSETFRADVLNFCISVCAATIEAHVSSLLRLSKAAVYTVRLTLGTPGNLKLCIDAKPSL